MEITLIVSTDENNDFVNHSLFHTYESYLVPVPIIGDHILFGDSHDIFLVKSRVIDIRNNSVQLYGMLL